MAQLVERVLGKDEVPGSNPGSSLKSKSNPKGLLFDLHYSRFVACSAKQNPVRGSSSEAKSIRVVASEKTLVLFEQEFLVIFAQRRVILLRSDIWTKVQVIFAPRVKRQLY